MSTSQKITIVTFIALFFVMYFGCETTSLEMRQLEKSRVLEPSFLNLEQEVQVAKSRLQEADRIEIEGFQLDIEESSSDEQKIEALKKLAGKWYGLSNPIISGYYAEQIAEIENTEDAWAISGTTHYLGLANAATENHKKYARQRALKAFENAISINPSNVDHKINSALCYVEYPENGQPMQGILMLRDLETAHPDAAGVHMQLGRLSIRTNQWDNALKRFKRVLELEPDNYQTYCYLSEVYNAKKDAIEAAKAADLCQKR